MADSKAPIELRAPVGVCDVSQRPTFRWRLRGERGRVPDLDPRRLRRELAATRLRLRIWKLGANANVPKVLARQTPLISEELPGHVNSIRLKREHRFETSVGYLWQVERLDRGGRVIVASDPTIFAISDPSVPFSLAQWECCDDDRLLAEEFSAWSVGYGTPDIRLDEAAPHGDKGIAVLPGNSVGGAAISQPFSNGKTIESGKHYAISFFARGSGTGEISRFRVYAHRGDLNQSGNHPAGSEGVFPIADSGALTTKDWRWVVLPGWCAPRTFDHIAISGIAGAGAVANICVREVDGCEGFFDAGAQGPTFDLGSNVQIDMTTPPSAHSVVTDLGALQDLYGERFGPDGEDRWYGSCTECVSIGGWIPEDYLDDIPWHSETALELDPSTLSSATEKAITTIKDLASKPGTGDGLEPIEFSPQDCPDFDPAPFPHAERQDVTADPKEPFSGRDIIYVHGINPGHVLGRIIAEDATLLSEHAARGEPFGDVTKLRADWPVSPDEFGPDGFFRSYAEDTYWQTHIDRYVVGPGRKNRYMVAGFNSSQRLVYAAHALLAQMAAAMSTGEGVREGNSEQGSACFGKECVIVSHSTGALVTIVAMAIAARTATDQALQDLYGDVSEIPQRVAAHVSLHGAIAGSELAGMAVGGAALVGAAGNTSVSASEYFLGMQIIAAAMLAEEEDEQAQFWLGLAQSGSAALAAALLTVPEVVFSSVLIDLTPQIARTYWGSTIDASMVPTLTVAGGHPTFGGQSSVPFLTKAFLAGFDDGVVGTNSQSGSSNPLGLDVFAYPPPAARIFDMGVAAVRSAPFFFEQAKGPGIAAYASTPTVSPTGMVQPALPSLSTPRFQNVYPFLLGASDHPFPTDAGEPDTANAGGSYAASLLARNYEESLVADDALLGSGLVSPDIAGLMRRYERRVDLTINLTVLVPRVTLIPLSFSIEEVIVPLGPITLWRRFYDLLGAPDFDEDDEASLTPSVTVVVNPDGTFRVGEMAVPDPLENALVGQPNETSYVYNYVLPS